MKRVYGGWGGAARNKQPIYTVSACTIVRARNRRVVQVCEMIGEI